MKKLTHLISLTALAVLLSLSCETKMDYSEANLVEESESNSLMKHNKKPNVLLYSGESDKIKLIAAINRSLEQLENALIVVGQMQETISKKETA